MPLRCLLFSSTEELVKPIWEVLADLGIEGEYCRNAVDAVERVTTQLFQIVITDWEDQPEAAFLLKTARDLKAAQRPLIVAIVGDDARLPEALRAGANSVLVKPIRTEQVRDTMSTACELLRSKLQPAAPQPVVQQAAAPAVSREVPETTALAAAAAAGAASAPASVTQAPEKTFRAGEFLTSASPAPGAQFDTETECDVQKSLDQAAAAEIDALTELEPMAAAVQEAVAEPSEPRTALTGWAALQSRLTQPMRQPVEDAPPKNEKKELLSYGETPSYGAPPAELAEKDKPPIKEESVEESESESALFDYMSGDLEDRAPRPFSKRGRVLLVSAFAVACVVLAAVPRTRHTLQMSYRNAVHAGGNWLNPPPAPLPQAVAQHDSFGQSGDEYKLPATGNIPDATTDPSKIRVLPVIDPTVKVEKGPETSGGQAPATTSESKAADQDPTIQNQPGQELNGQAQAGQDQIKDLTQTSAGNVPGSSTEASPGAAPTGAQAQPNAAAVRAAAPQPHLVTSTGSAPPHAVSAAGSTGIPSSLKSRMASTTPDASGNKPVEAAMSSIEPVNLPESTARELLTQPVDPVYPAAAKASGQRGSVVLQVHIGRDGAVQDVKFLQGSLVFARSAIDAVRQWRFKPYSMNGRAVSVQSMITLNFKPPA
jgi:protein TonB